MAWENLRQVIFRRLRREGGLEANGRAKHELAVAAGFLPTNVTSRQHLHDFSHPLWWTPRALTLSR